MSGQVAAWTARERWALALFLVILAATWWQAPWPHLQALHHSLTVLALLGLLWVRRRYAMPFSSLLLVLAFLLLHSVAARWIYSYVPYDDWTQAVFGRSLSEVTGWERNHFDRLVHITYGLCLAPVLFRYFVDERGWRRGWSALLAVDIVLSTSALYELAEWALAMSVDPATAEAYNGQQGDIWDAHADTALAFVAAIVAVTVLLIRRRSPGTERGDQPSPRDLS